MYILFWTSLLIIIYSYLGYPSIIYVLSLLAKLFKPVKERNQNAIYKPEVTLFVSAYNELKIIDKKIENSFSLNYPQEKLKHVWITDGSNDGSHEYLFKYKNIQTFHKDKREGKIGAINRGMSFVNTPIVVFSDANSMLNKESINNIVDEFKDPLVGCVAGEKRIVIKDKDNAVNSGEGIYWKYESFIKKSESQIGSALGAVGELFAIRKDLFEEIENDTILDDFIISLRIAQKGFKIKYVPEAYAIESASINIHEELKRKTRIAYGGFQTITRLKSLLNPLKNPLLTFQYFSHKILRWTLVPFAFLTVLISNLYLAIEYNWKGFFSIVFSLQIIFYFFVLLGGLLQSKKTNFKILFAPYYLFIMNLAEIIGLLRFLRKSQSVNWEKAKRE